MAKLSTVGTLRSLSIMTASLSKLETTSASTALSKCGDGPAGTMVATTPLSPLCPARMLTILRWTPVSRLKWRARTPTETSHTARTHLAPSALTTIAEMIMISMLPLNPTSKTTISTQREAQAATFLETTREDAISPPQFNPETEYL
jgi:hypothetical protein